MVSFTTFTDEDIKVAAAAIANERGGRRGMPRITNVLDLLPKNLADEVTEDAKAALKAVATLRDGQKISSDVSTNGA